MPLPVVSTPPFSSYRNTTLRTLIFDLQLTDPMMTPPPPSHALPVRSKGYNAMSELQCSRQLRN